MPVSSDWTHRKDIDTGGGGQVEVTRESQTVRLSTLHVLECV